MFDSLSDRLPYILTALIVLACLFVLAWLVRWTARSFIGRYDASLAQMIGGLAYLALLSLGVLLALWIAIPSVRFSTVFTSLGVTGIILGFALKDILENFVAGLIILWRRPFRVGDQIGSGAFEGDVMEINFRATVLRSFDGIRVYIPNGSVLTQPVQNFTSYRSRRASVCFGIDQKSDVGRIRRAILDELVRIDGVLPSPEPLVLFESIGDFTNNLEVLYWTAPPSRLSDRTTRSDVTERLFTAVQAAGASFPMPIQQVVLRSASSDGGSVNGT